MPINERGIEGPWQPSREIGRVYDIVPADNWLPFNLYSEEGLSEAFQYVLTYDQSLLAYSGSPKTQRIMALEILEDIKKAEAKHKECISAVELEA